MFAVSERPDHPASDPNLKAGCPPGALLFQIPHIHSVTAPSWPSLDCIFPSLCHGHVQCGAPSVSWDTAASHSSSPLPSVSLTPTAAGFLLPHFPLIKSPSAFHHPEFNNSQCSSALTHWLHSTQWTSFRLFPGYFLCLISLLTLRLHPLSLPCGISLISVTSKCWCSPELIS